MFAFLSSSTSSPEAVCARLLNSFKRGRGFFATVEHPPDGTVRVAARPLWLWLPNPDVRMKIVPSVAGTNLHVRAGVRLYWYLLLAVLAISAFLGITQTFNYGPIQEGYGIATTPVVTRHVASWTVVCVAAFCATVVALLLGLANAWLCIRQARSATVPPN